MNDKVNKFDLQFITIFRTPTRHANFVVILIFEVFMWISTLYILYAFYYY